MTIRPKIELALTPTLSPRRGRRFNGFLNRPLRDDSLAPGLVALLLQGERVGVKASLIPAE
jgi:hypothetical protein